MVYHGTAAVLTDEQPQGVQGLQTLPSPHLSSGQIYFHSRFCKKNLATFSGNAGFSWAQTAQSS